MLPPAVGTRVGGCTRPGTKSGAKKEVIRSLEKGGGLLEELQRGASEGYVGQRRWYRIG